MTRQMVMATRSALLLIMLVGLSTGCATRRERTLTKVLQDLADEHAAEKSAQTVGLDAPDQPAGTLPALLGDAGLPGGGGDLTIQSDCLLHITVAEDPGLDGSYPVNEIGAVQLGYIGPVILFNKTEEQAARKIEETLKRRDFRNATVKVRIQRASYDRVRIDGAVNAPGMIQIGSGDAITLNDALLRVGGLKPTLRGAKIKVVRGGVTNALVAQAQGEELELVAENGQSSIPDIRLRNNDFAYVFSTAAPAALGGNEKEILVLGEVKRPGIYRFASDEPCTMMHLLLKMGGLPPYANMKKIAVVRRDKAGNEQAFVINGAPLMDEGRPEDDFQLESGDRIKVHARVLNLF